MLNKRALPRAFSRAFGSFGSSTQREAAELSGGGMWDYGPERRRQRAARDRALVVPGTLKCQSWPLSQDKESKGRDFGYSIAVIVIHFYGPQVDLVRL